MAASGTAAALDTALVLAEAAGAASASALVSALESGWVQGQAAAPVRVRVLAAVGVD